MTNFHFLYDGQALKFTVGNLWVAIETPYHLSNWQTITEIKGGVEKRLHTPLQLFHVRYVEINQEGIKTQCYRLLKKMCLRSKQKPYLVEPFTFCHVRTTNIQARNMIKKCNSWCQAFLCDWMAQSKSRLKSNRESVERFENQCSSALAIWSC